MNAMAQIKPKPQLHSRSVSLDQITHDDAFCFRRGGIDATHRADLASTIRNTERPLDPILLWQPDEDQPGHLVLLDGAHRYAAYMAVDWPYSVPASVLVGADRRTALSEALQRNAKRVLALSKSERMDAAWRLVREPVLPRFKVKEIVRLADVGSRTVDNMRARWRTIHEEGLEVTGVWALDQHSRSDVGEALSRMSDATRTAEIERLASDFRDLTDRRKHPERAILCDCFAVWEAFELAYGEKAVKSMFAYLMGDGRDADEWLELASTGYSQETDDEDEVEPQF